MLIKKFLGIALLMLCLISCSKQVSTTFETVSAKNQAYSLEIPQGYSEYRCYEDFLSYTRDDGGTIISIQKKPSQESLSEYANEMKQDTFTYSVVSETPNTIVYQITRGTNMWRAYEFYGMKEIKGVIYVVKFSSSELTQDNMDDIFNRMMSSLH